MQVKVGCFLGATHADLISLVEVWRGAGAVPGEGVCLLLVFVLLTIFGNRVRVDQVASIGNCHVVGSLASHCVFIEELCCGAGWNVFAAHRRVV